MVTVEETRRSKLQLLVKQYGMADLCEKLGYARNETAGLTRIANGNIRHERGTMYVMGSPMAREIESKLDLPRGWMDTPISFSELQELSDKRSAILQVMEKVPADKWDIAIRLLNALASHTDEEENSLSHA